MNFVRKAALIGLSLGALLTVSLNANAAAVKHHSTQKTVGNTTRITHYATDGKTVSGYVIKTVDPKFGNMTVTREDANRNVTYTYVTKKGQSTDVKPINHFSNDRNLQGNLATNPY
ncbi:Tat pathway signal sequence domain protein [Lentilactobacillus parafarraginis F0439]|uniref:Tat pathway signal sequence domain protein n=1 Tax=Lentilactobacillus parafarraginis F0439 TaxID=797515 RepID=G9ZLX6_9LACO|nr:hypothetical protein [Lentilactobacillus parafarraginis]EHM00209.1 Tat pathway signal sequence domain protein [Lentilactobacillus parafarraginis F0439]